MLLLKVMSWTFYDDSYDNICYLHHVPVGGDLCQTLSDLRASCAQEERHPGVCVCIDRMEVRVHAYPWVTLEQNVLSM